MSYRILDLFCGAGGASRGYADAGFEITGVDHAPQPNYPFEIILGDALHALAEIDLGRFDAIHASPPCPAYSQITRATGNPEEHPDLVGPTREALRATGLPYVIENVIGAPLIDWTLFCGEAFGLGATCSDGKWRPLRRHRLIESSWIILSPGCACSGREPIGVYGWGGANRKTARNGGASRGYMGDPDERARAMGLHGLTPRELSNAIPPAYTLHIGWQLAAHLRSRVEVC